MFADGIPHEKILQLASNVNSELLSPTYYTVKPNSIANYCTYYILVQFETLTITRGRLLVVITTH